MPRSNKTNKAEYGKSMTLDEAGDLLDKYAEPAPTPTPTTKKVEDAKKAIKKRDTLGVHTRSLLKKVDD
jgi:transposase